MCKVLVIDDDRDFAEGVASLLETDGRQAVIAVSAEEALALLDESIDVVLSDIKLGPISGADLLCDIKSRQDVPVIMITAYASTDTAILSLKNRASDYLIKPCDPEEIIASVAKAYEETGVLKAATTKRRDLVERMQELRDEL